MNTTQDIGSNKRIAKNLLFNSISFAVNFIVSFFFTPYLIRTVGKEAYSFFPLVNNIIGYSSIITTAVGSMAGRFITMHIYKDDLEGANRYLNSMWVANLLLSVLFTLLSILCVVFIDDILTVPSYLLREVQSLFGFGLISLVLGLLTGYLGIATYVKNRVDLSSSASMICNLIRIGSILLLFYLFKPSIVFMSLSALIAGIASIFFNYNFKKRLLPELTIDPKRFFSFAYVKQLISSGVWNSVNQLSYLLLNQFDLLLTNAFIGASVTGDYAIAKTVPNLILQLVAMLSGTFYAHFNILYAKEKREDVIEEARKSMIIVGMIMALPIGFISVFSADFYSLWVPFENAQFLQKLTLWTIIPLIISTSINPIFGLFTITNKLKVPSIVLLVSGIMQTVVIYVLLIYSNLGVWAIVITSSFEKIFRNFFFTMIYGARCLGKPWFSLYPTLFRGICGSFMVIGICLLFNSFYEITTWFDFIYMALLTCSISFILNLFVMMKRTERNRVFILLKSHLFQHLKL